MKKAIGYCLIGSPFVALFLATAYVLGPTGAIMTFAGCAAVVGVIVLGAYLVTR